MTRVASSQRVAEDLEKLRAYRISFEETVRGTVNLVNRFHRQEESRSPVSQRGSEANRSDEVAPAQHLQGRSDRDLEALEHNVAILIDRNSAEAALLRELSEKIEGIKREPKLVRREQVQMHVQAILQLDLNATIYTTDTTAD